MCYDDDHMYIIEHSERVEMTDTHDVRITNDSEVIRIPLNQKESTRLCWHCGSDRLILLRTFSRKHCVECGSTIPWELEKNQKALK